MSYGVVHAQRSIEPDAAPACCRKVAEAGDETRETVSLFRAPKFRHCRHRAKASRYAYQTREPAGLLEYGRKVRRGPTIITRHVRLVTAGNRSCLRPFVRGAGRRLSSATAPFGGPSNPSPPQSLAHVWTPRLRRHPLQGPWSAKAGQGSCSMIPRRIPLVCESRSGVSLYDTAAHSSMRKQVRGPSL